MSRVRNAHIGGMSGEAGRGNLVPVTEAHEAILRSLTEVVGMGEVWPCSTG